MSGKQEQHAPEPENAVRRSDTDGPTKETTQGRIILGDLRLTEVLLKQLNDAERALDESLDAHEKMREVYLPEGYLKLRPPSDPAIWAIHVRRLATDVRNYVRTGIDVAAQAVFPLGSLEQFRELLPKMAKDIETRTLARVNPRDPPLFDAPSVSEFAANRVSEWLIYAERKLKPAWMDKGSDERDTNSKPQQAQPPVRTGAVETDGPRFEDKPIAETNSSEVDQADKGQDRRGALRAGVLGEASARIRKTAPPTHNWEDIEITLISDERIEIKIGEHRETCNYHEMECVDRRTGNPNSQWAILQALAREQGRLPEEARQGKQWLAISKRIERVRKVLQKKFGLSEDPLPYTAGAGYCARFKIRRGRAAES